MRLGPFTFAAVWLLDFEFHAPDGEKPRPICLVGHELISGARLRLWEDELASMHAPPFAQGDDVLIVSYFASAELGCFLALGWPLPANVLDLHAEFRLATNGERLSCAAGLLGALVYFGLGGMSSIEKAGMRGLAIRGGPYTSEERRALLDYCSEDVAALASLLPHMLPRLDLPRALLRGRYLRSVARMEARGVPLDVTALNLLRRHWDGIKEDLVRRIDGTFKVYEGLAFRTDRFAEFLLRQRIPWPRTGTGRLALDDDTFKDMALAYPVLQPLRELRGALSKMRLAKLAVGADGRNRCLLSPFSAVTGRNQPSNARFIFGPSAWLRGLIKPEPGTGLAYVDYSQQEFGIAAALSGDPAMLAAYVSGDPYLAFARQAGAVPPHATKESHGEVRDRFKAAALAVQYGMGAESLAIRLGLTAAGARELLQLHRSTYPRFWAWSQAAVDHAMLGGSLSAAFGWTVRVTANTSARMLANFPMQANGAEMLRIACCLATEQGIGVCAPVHDALLIEAPIDQLDEAAGATTEAMAKASSEVLGGFRLRSDTKVVRYPDRYMDPRGRVLWDTVWQVISDRE